MITGITEIAHITTKQDMSRWTRAHADAPGITWSVFAGEGGTMIIVEHAEDRCAPVGVNGAGVNGAGGQVTSANGVRESAAAMAGAFADGAFEAGVFEAIQAGNPDIARVSA